MTAVLGEPLPRVEFFDVPNLSDVTDMTRAFYKSGVGTIPNINDWDVSSVTDMTYMFLGCDFNQPLNEWDLNSLNLANLIFHLSDMDCNNYSLSIFS